MSWNLLNYPDPDTTFRNTYYRTVIHAVDPDILVVNEINGEAGVDGFLKTVLNSSGFVYSAGSVIDHVDSDNAIFYKHSTFDFLSNTAITTDYRDINEFKLFNRFSGDTLLVYGAHLKSSSGTANELQRAIEIDSLRKYTNSFSGGKDYLLCGDFNIYSSTEPAYQKLISQSSGSGYFIDPLKLTGAWNNSLYASYHTQSTRVRKVGYGATGGLNDRFDMILFSPSLVNNQSVSFVNGSYKAFGNDGNHFQDSINSLPNYAVSNYVANALHFASDHLPVICELKFSKVGIDESTHKDLDLFFIENWKLIMRSNTKVDKQILINIYDVKGCVIASRSVNIYGNEETQILFTELKSFTGSVYVNIQGAEWNYTKQFFINAFHE